MVRKSIPPGINPPSSHLPRRLDKPVYTATSHTYADILKKQFSLASTPTTSAITNNRPPRKWQASIIDYDSDQSIDSPVTTTTVSTSGSSPSNSTSTTATTAHTDYAAEMMALKNEISSLKTLLTNAITQFKQAMESINVTAHTPVSNAMEMDNEVANEGNQLPEPNPIHPIPLDLTALLTDFKRDIATMVNEMRPLVNHQSTYATNTHLPPNHVT